MRRVKLEAWRDEMTGELGLILSAVRKHSEMNSAQEGLLIAHDVIEHVNRPEDIGTIDDELEALGAIWYVRGQFHDLRRDHVGSHYTTHQNIAADVSRMFRDHVSGAQFVSYAPLKTRECDADADLNEILSEAAQSWRGEFNSDEVDDAAPQWARYAAVALHRMRIGYRKAARKWRRYGGAMAANRAFWSIAEAVAPHAKHVEIEGAEYLLTYDPQSGRAFCEEHYPEDY